MQKLFTPCMIEIAWVELVHHDPGFYKQEILANCGLAKGAPTQAI